MNGPSPHDRDSLIEAGVQQFQARQLSAAEARFREALAINPDDEDALHLLGLVRHQSGHSGDAVENIQKAVELDPSNVGFLNNLGLALQAVGKPGEALECFRKILEITSDAPEAHINLGNALKDLGQTDDAIASYGQALALKPDSPEAHFNLATVQHRTGGLEDALESYDRALALKPDFPQAVCNRGNVLNDLGRLEDAVESLQTFISRWPEFARAEAHADLGNALKELGRLDEAVASYRKALAIEPDYAEAHNNLGMSLKELGKLDEAVVSCRKALAVKPDMPEAHYNLGNAFKELGRLEDAIRSHHKAVAVKPDYAEAHTNLGLALLLGGQLKEGWEEFEWRWKGRGSEKLRDFTQPPWQGGDLKGKTILVASEQGIGDEVMFAGQVPDLLDADAHVMLECERRLLPVFERSFPDVECIIKADPPVTAGRADIDFQIFGASLGRWLRPDVESYPGRESYLLADGGWRDALRAKYRGGGDDLLVGLAWNSNNVEMGPRKSLPLAAYAPLTEITGIRFIDLQYGDTAAAREAFETETGVEVFHDPDIDQFQDLDAFAAQVAAMDLLISVSTTAVHFAGALGVPAWVLLNTVPRTCWMMEGETSHLYSSLRLYRQRQAGEWVDVVDAVKEDLGGFKPG